MEFLSIFKFKKGKGKRKGKESGDFKITCKDNQELINRFEENFLTKTKSCMEISNTEENTPNLEVKENSAKY